MTDWALYRFTCPCCGRTETEAAQGRWMPEQTRVHEHGATSFALALRVEPLYTRAEVARIGNKLQNALKEALGD